MKKSLELLILTPNGKKEPISIAGSSKLLDSKILKESKKIINSSERINYLKNIIRNETNTVLTYPRSTMYLTKLVSKENPKYACELVSLLCYCTTTSPEFYLLYAEIAIKNKAWLVANSALDIAKWLSFGKYSHCIDRVKKLSQLVTQKINKKSFDNSTSNLWKDKVLEKSKTLVVLRNSLDKNNFFEYSIHLLNTFPEEKESFNYVYELLQTYDDSEFIEKFRAYIMTLTSLDTEFKNLYLGIMNYDLLEIDKSIELLNEVLKINNKNLQANIFLCLDYLISNKVDKFAELFKKLLPDLSQDFPLELFKSNNNTFLATLLIYGAFFNINIKNLELTNHQLVSSQISRIISKFVKLGNFQKVEYLINQFQKLNYQIFLPLLNIYIGEILVREKNFNKAKEVLNNSSDVEKHRILALIFRLEGKEQEAEDELIKYRQTNDSSKSQGMIFKLLSLNMPNSIPADTNQILILLENIYAETKKMKQEIALEYGVNQNTCIESTCQECCKQTFPFVSYTEYLYLKQWLDNQPEELKKQVYENSKKIVAQYKEKYKREPPFLDADTNLDSNKYYPKGYSFDCPALKKEGCGVYEAQPFICRAYGYASDSMMTIMGCAYFKEQMSVANKLSPERKAINITSFANFANLTDKKLIGTAVIAPIPVWFAQEHEITVWKASGHLLTRSVFAPFFSWLANFRIKRLKDKNKNKLS